MKQKSKDETCHLSAEIDEAWQTKNRQLSRVETREEPIECGREPIKSGRRFGGSYVSKIRVQTKIDFGKVRKRKT